MLWEGGGFLEIFCVFHVVSGVWIFWSLKAASELIISSKKFFCCINHSRMVCCLMIFSCIKEDILFSLDGKIWVSESSMNMQWDWSKTKLFVSMLINKILKNYQLWHVVLASFLFFFICFCLCTKRSWMGIPFRTRNCLRNFNVNHECILCFYF